MNIDVLNCKDKLQFFIAQILKVKKSQTNFCKSEILRWSQITIFEPLSCYYY